MATDTQDLLELAEEAEDEADQAEETLESELVIDPDATEEIESAVREAVEEGELSDVYSRFTQFLERALRIRAEVFLLQQSTEEPEAAIENVERILSIHRQKVTIPYIVTCDGERRNERVQLELENEFHTEWGNKRTELLESIFHGDTSDSSFWSRLGEADELLEDETVDVPSIIKESYITSVAERIDSRVAQVGFELLRDFLIAYIAALAVDSSRSDSKSEDVEALATGHINVADDESDFAANHYQRAIELDPENRRAHNNYANLLQKEFDQYRKAEEHYERALEVDPEYAHAHHNYALLLQNEFNQYRKAKEHYERALELDPEYVLAHNNYATLLWEEFNQYRKAKEHYERALELDPEDVLAHNNYANLLMDEFNQYRKAKEHYERALELDSEHAPTHHNYAICLRNLNYLFEARKHEKRAERLS